MPLYEYYCLSCQTSFDRLRPVATADEPADCPNCGSPEDVRRTITHAVMVGAAGAEVLSPATSGSNGAGGGCCGGGCGCGR